jgi:5-methylcytosine-specific restriction endonuclease McrBC regulatory subunit McrC
MELREKIDGALAALLAHATHDAFKIHRVAAPGSELGDLAALIVHQLLDSIVVYATRGRDFRYARQRRVGSLIGGKIDMTRSLRLRARGLGHLFVFEKNVLSHNTPLNRVLSATLREVERLQTLIDIRSDDIARARGLAMLFSDCLDAELLFARREHFVTQANSLLGSGLPDPVKDMVALAAVVLSHESFETSASAASHLPRAWFLNLETLFEAAVRKSLAQIAPDGWLVLRGRDEQHRVFSGEYEAHPDLVVRCGGNVFAVGDVKYKDWHGSATASDVYQLLVHASSFGSSRAFLVYPSDRFEVRSLGRSATGAETWFFGVDVRDLQTGIELVAETLGLEKCQHPPCSLPAEGSHGAGDAPS